MNVPTVGLALIARDEEGTLPALLESVQGAFDEVALVDTGSKDRTVALFEEWAQGEIQEGRLGAYRVDRFEWCDDFAAPRALADSLLDTDWNVWADCDDTIPGAHNLRAIAAQAPPEQAAFVADYHYAHAPDGTVVCLLKRERLVRRGAGTWQGRVHEAQTLAGPVGFIDPQACRWVHHKPPTVNSSPRNMRILRAWLNEEPENPRVLSYLGTEELARGKAKRALSYFRRYLALQPGWDEERAQVHRKHALALIALGQLDAAIDTAMQALRLLPSWPDSYLTLAEAYYHKGQVHKAKHWAERVLDMGVPDSMLIINPLDYTGAPRVLLAGSLGGMGLLDDAIEEAERALQILPEHQGLLDGLAGWRKQRLLESTASTFVGAADLLVHNDQQADALSVLNSVPFFVRDHPAVVEKRRAIRERVDTGRVETFTRDGDVLAIGDQLPRCAFLLAGLQEQATAA